ncbi:hypothetical protein O3M35_000475 [Rhynocoris fuscipes]|uniref:Maturase K n=1 Tax=Rhynocoris fuscipes TaxID=488301 RepID=A0AAW1DSQ8_9HEMI
MLFCGGYLYKIGQRSSLTCRTCRLSEYYEHIVMECNQFSTERDMLFNELYRFLPSPFHFQEIIFSNNADFKISFQFLINYNSS